MKTKQMGRTGLKVSEVCLGTMTFGNQADQAASFAIMDAADEDGVDFFDTADVYPLGGDLKSVGRTEEIIGSWLTGRRSDFVLATKCVGRTGRRRCCRGRRRRAGHLDDRRHHTIAEQPRCQRPDHGAGHIGRSGGADRGGGQARLSRAR